MNLYPTLSKLYPEGFHGGQCAAWAEQVMDFGPIGDSLAEKEMYVKLNGIIAPNIAEIGRGYRAGDVVVTTESADHGHVCILLDPNTMTVVESNFHLDEKVHYGRVVPKEKIYGIIRAPFKVDLGQCEVNFSILINNQPPWNLKVFDDLQQTILGWTNNKLKVNFFPIATSQSNWWYETIIFPMTGLQNTVIAKGYMSQNVAPLASANNNQQAHVFAFVVRPDQWQGTAMDGQELAYTVPDIRPGQIQASCAEFDMSPWYAGMRLINHILPHELSHFLHYVNGLNDTTHQFDNPTAKQLEQVFNDLDFNRVKANL